MGILDSLFGSGSAQPAPQAVAQTAQPPQNYNDFLQQVIAAATANEKAHPSDFMSWITGNGRDAAAAVARAKAPEAWQALQSGQNTVQNGQLGVLQNLMYMNRMNPNAPAVDANNIPGSYTNAGRAPIAPAAPADPSAAPAPQAAATPQMNPLQAQRAQLGSMANAMMGLPQYLKDADALRTQLQVGAPPNTAVTAVDGLARDGITGAPLTTSVNAYLADRAGKTATAEEAPKHAAKISEQGNQAYLDRGTHAANADVDASHELVNGIDTRTGLPATRTKAGLLQNTDGFAASNPFFDGQQGEIKDLRTKADSADQVLNMGQQIANAANGVFTGKGANSFQEARKLALTVGNLTGVQPSDDILNNTSKFEQLKFASQQLAAVAAHALSARTSNMLYGAISAVKPGDQTSVKGLRDVIVNDLLPEALQTKARLRATTNYYQKNPLKNDAASVVDKQIPLQNFGVKSPYKGAHNEAQPGDYYLDPTGNLRQRPAQ